jgi:hypothetical protein
LFVFCDCSHWFSSAATAFSAAALLCCACDHAMLPSESKPSAHHTPMFFMVIPSLSFALRQRALWPPPGGD